MIKTPGLTGQPLTAVLPSTPIQRIGNDAGRLLVAVQKASVATPHFTVGETVTARLVEALPQRQWLAVVKDTPITLHWPVAASGRSSPDPASGPPRGPSAQQTAPMPSRGEVLTLRVVSTTPRLTFVLDDGAPAPAASAAVAVQLSDAARKLSELVRAGDRGALSPRPASLDTTAILLGNPGASPLARAQSLALAIRQSGLFYESHLRAWGEGRHTLDMLRTEPQARAGEALKADSSNLRDAATEELGQVLQRQLDVLDGKSLGLSAQAWPGQRVEWQIQREQQAHPSDDGSEDSQNERQDGQEAMDTWTTQIHLVLPRLGALGASLRIAGSQVSLQMTTDSPASAGLIDTYRERLQAGLQRAGLSLGSLSIAQGSPAPVAHDPTEGNT